MKAVLIIVGILIVLVVVYLLAKNTMFFAKGGYKVGDKVGNDCLCASGVWADECCKKAVSTRNTGIQY